jgi:hypothetical protein
MPHPSRERSQWSFPRRYDDVNSLLGAIPTCYQALRLPLRQPVELRTHLVDIGMVKASEEVERGSPCDTSGVRLAKGVVSVTEVVERLCPAAAVVLTIEERQRPPVAGDRPPVFPEVVMGVAEAIPGKRLIGCVSGRLMNRQCPFAVGDSLPVITELGTRPGDHVKGTALEGT